MKKESKLSNKQIAFCNEYVVDFNATQAAIRAGYSKRTAAVIASENLIKPNIQTYLKGLQDHLAVKHSVTKDMIVQELKKIGFSDIRKIFGESGCLKDISKIDDATAAAISSVEVDELQLGGISIGKTKKLKFWAKTNALDSLAKMLGYNAPEKILIDYNNLSDDQLNEIINELKQSIK